MTFTFLTLPPKNKFDPAQNITNADRKADQVFRDYMLKLDILVSVMAGGTLPLLNMSNLANAANDAAAALAGVPVSGVYRNGSVLMVRVS